MTFVYVGKSTLINALLNREDVDFVEGKPHNMYGSAPTGVWQTTMATLCYGYPVGHELQYVRLWDMAGCGTHEHPSANYFEEKALYAFDVLIIVAENELGEYEYTILQKAQQQNIPVVIVITKAEEKVESKIRKAFNARNPPLEEYKRVIQQTTDEARNHIATCLQKKGLQNTLAIIVSAWKYRDLMMDLETSTNENQQETNSNQEVRENMTISQKVSDDEINQQTASDHEIRPEVTAAEENRMKTALLSFELSQLLHYLATTAIQRRL